MCEILPTAALRCDCWAHTKIVRKYEPPQKEKVEYGNMEDSKEKGAANRQMGKGNICNVSDLLGQHFSLLAETLVTRWPLQIWPKIDGETLSG